MKKVIALVSFVTVTAVYGAAQLFQLMPTAIGTAVIAEKSEKAIGGQAATLLPTKLTSKQGRLLNMAYSIAKEEGVSPELVQSVLLQESDAGGLKKYKVANEGPEAYFGPMQIKLAATRDVLERNPTLFDKYNFHTRSADEIKANLILNEDFNIRVAVKYLKMLKSQYGFTGRELMNAYNRGPGGVRAVDSTTFHYALSAEKKLASWKSR